MEQKERIAKALAATIGDIDVPALQGYSSGELRQIPLSDHLDSLGMVNLIIGMEDSLNKEFGREIQLLGRSDVFHTDSLKTAGAFIDFIDRIL